MRVLAIDDDDGVTGIIASVCKQLNIPNHCVSDPGLIEGVDVSAFNLVFLDLLMPGKDGVEVVRDLSKIQFRGHIVLMSGFDSSVLNTVKELAHEHHLNVLAHMSKPFRLEKIHDLISQAKTLKAENHKTCPKVNQLSVEQIKDAIEGDCIVPYYQPQIDLTSHSLVGVEALMRLKLNDRLIFPDHFIPVAEKFGQIHDLTKVIVRKSLTDFKLLLAKQEKLTLSINLSGKDLEKIEFADWLEATVKEFDIPSAKVVLEVTETQKIMLYANAMDVLSRLRLKGFRISIDDFGTGSAVLAQIKRLPVTELKIDRSFVQDALDHKKSQALIKSTVNLCHELELDIVAEGIENEATEALILELGCHIGQGFLYSKAISFEELKALIENRKQNVPTDSICIIEQENAQESEQEVNLSPQSDGSGKEAEPSVLAEHKNREPSGSEEQSPVDEEIPEIVALNETPEIVSESFLDFVLPLSGRFAFIGQSQKVGAELAFKQVQKRVDPSRLSLRFLNDDSELKKLVKVIKKDLDDKTLAVVGPAFPLILSQAFLKQTRDVEVPIIAPFNGSEQLRQSSAEKIYNFKPGFREEMLSIVSKLRSRQGKVLFLLAKGKLAKAIEPICRTLEESEIVFYDPQEPDVAIKYVMQNSPAHLVFFGTARTMARLINEVNNEHIHYYATSLVGIGMIKRLLVRKAKLKLEITDPLPDFQANIPAARSFRRAFADCQPSLPEKFMNTISFETYLVTKLLLEIYQKNGRKLDRASLEQSLQSLFSYDLGLDSPVSWGDESRQLLHQVYHIRI